MHISRATTQAVPITSSWQKVIERSRNRIGLILSVPTTGTVALAFGNPNEYNLVEGTGHKLSSANSPLLLVFGLDVPLVQSEIYASSTDADQQLVITEIFAADSCAETVTRTGQYK
jgi:hypothetical protein